MRNAPARQWPFLGEADSPAFPGGGESQAPASWPPGRPIMFPGGGQSQAPASWTPRPNEFPMPEPTLLSDLLRGRRRPGGYAHG